MVSDPSNKKELKYENAKLRGLTLLFEDKQLEKKWNKANAPKTRSMTVRYLFSSALFQGVFMASDILESRKIPLVAEALFVRGMVRLALGGLPIIICLFVATGFVIPTQSALFLTNLLYGVPTLAMHYTTRVNPSHWDSLYVNKC
jgi:ABC-type transporter Mla maintaining outer membrane lipid asymmetry permease subunit MlaE